MAELRGTPILIPGLGPVLTRLEGIRQGTRASGSVLPFALTWRPIEKQGCESKLSGNRLDVMFARRPSPSSELILSILSLSVTKFQTSTEYYLGCQGGGNKYTNTYWYSAVY
jgi:hypothetical protein